MYKCKSGASMYSTFKHFAKLAICELNTCNLLHEDDIIVIYTFSSFQHAIDAVSAGVSPIGDTSYNSSYWDWGSAFFFAGTVITTIGIY